ncbi:MAG: hypothetical protein ACXVZV_01845 [Terriglobales bacterium]
MSEITVAETKMNAAKNALLRYVEQRKALDGDQYRRLVARVKRAEAEFMRGVSELGG